MKITSKGQVTIPQAVREQARLYPHSEVSFEVLPNGDVTVEMGQTRFAASDLPFEVSGLATQTQGQDTLYGLELATTPPQTVWLSAVAISNPHAVQVVANIEAAPVNLLGPMIESHPRFTRRVNAGFMQIIDLHTIYLRVYERGAGETLACGTGACAAVAAGIRRGLLESPVRVRTHGGWLTVAFDCAQLRMTGPATTVYSGSIDIDQLVASIPSLTSSTT